MKIQIKKMSSFQFDSKLFTPMKTGTRVDAFFSSDGGVMPGTNFVITGDPGVGKTTVLLDVLADLQKKGKKVLFVSGEMNAIDMVGYCKRYPKFSNVDILFLGEYADADPMIVLSAVLNEGFDCVLIDSLAEVANAIVDFDGKGTYKSATSKVLTLMEDHNLGKNKTKINTAFLIIQQVTKSGAFAGSNRIKHMTTGMAHMKFQDSERYIVFSKNRRGGNMNKLFFSLSTKNQVNWTYEAPNNE